MSDQADSLRQLVRMTVKSHPALELGVPIFVLSGGKRGVGTSTVAAQIAEELARLGKRAVLIDANPAQPDLTNRLASSRSGSLSDVLAGKRSVVEVLTPVSDRVRLLPGQWNSDSPPELHRLAVKRFLKEVRALHSHADVVVLDAGEGMSPWVQWLWKAAQQILLVTNTEPTAVTESYATIKLAPWGDVDGKLRLIVNRTEDKNAADRVGNNFAATCRQFLGIKIGTHAAVARGKFSDAAGIGKQEDREFTQSVRLLAAELLSTCLILEARTSRRVANCHSEYHEESGSQQSPLSFTPDSSLRSE